MQTPSPVIQRWPRLTRRRLGGLGLTTVLAAACVPLSREIEPMTTRQRNGTPTVESDLGRLHVRPGDAPSIEDEQVAPFGAQTLTLDTERDALLYVPTTYQHDRPAPLAVMLHGAGGNAQHGLDLLRERANAGGYLLLAPAAFGRTWDLLIDNYGVDILTLDAALAEVFRLYTVDPARLAIGGFSDGASYALSVGVTNGDLFSHIIAFSPGYLSPAEQRGRPRIFISHGIYDEILPIDRCSRCIVPALKEAGYAVDYHEFNGSHAVPSSTSEQALTWWLDKAPPVEES
jgi:phospholipase/carboxylesterase